MTQTVADDTRITPDAEVQLIKRRSGEHEVRCRSTASQAMILQSPEEILEHIEVLAEYARRLDQD